MRIISKQQVEDLLDLDQLVESLATAMAEVSSGAAAIPPRVAALVPERGGFLLAGPAYLPSSEVLEAKLVSIFPQNARSGLPTHQAVILVFDPANGTPVALMDATYITEARTAAGSVLATRLLARPDAKTLAILGTGVQARAHAHAMARFRSWREVRLAGRDQGKTQALARELSAQLGLPVRACPSYREALRDADVACATTHSPEPVVRREWLPAGIHVNSVGFNPQGPEVDAATVAAALVVVESRRVALTPFPVGSHDLNQPLRDGLITPEHIHAEVGELVLGTRPGRTSPEQITLYKSVGVAAQDAAAAALVFALARERGIGVEIAL